MTSTLDPRATAPAPAASPVPSPPRPAPRPSSSMPPASSSSSSTPRPARPSRSPSASGTSATRSTARAPTRTRPTSSPSACASPGAAPRAACRRAVLAQPAGARPAPCAPARRGAGCVEHLREATRGGRIRSTITVFAPDRPGRPGPPDHTSKPRALRRDRRRAAWRRALRRVHRNGPAAGLAAAGARTLRMPRRRRLRRRGWVTSCSTSPPTRCSGAAVAPRAGVVRLLRLRWMPCPRSAACRSVRTRPRRSTAGTRTPRSARATSPTPDAYYRRLWPGDGLTPARPGRFWRAARSSSWSARSSTRCRGAARCPTTTPRQSGSSPTWPGRKAPGDACPADWSWIVPPVSGAHRGLPPLLRRRGAPGVPGTRRRRGRSMIETRTSAQRSPSTTA